MQFIIMLIIVLIFVGTAILFDYLLSQKHKRIHKTNEAINDLNRVMTFLRIHMVKNINIIEHYKRAPWDEKQYSGLWPPSNEAYDNKHMIEELIKVTGSLVDSLEKKKLKFK